jgi:lipoprotein
MKKVFFVFLALVAFASCKKDDLPNSPSSGEKEVVRLSLSGDLGEARGLILTPKEQGGKVKIEVKSEDRKLRATYMIVSSTGQNIWGSIDLKVDADGKKFQGMEDIDISSLGGGQLKVSLLVRTGSATPSTVLQKFNTTQPVSASVALISTGNNLVRGADPHGMPHIVARNLSLKMAGFLLRMKIKNDTDKDYHIRAIRSESFGVNRYGSLSYSTTTDRFSIPIDHVTNVLTFPEGNQGILLRSGEESQDEYLFYCATSPSQYSRGEIALDVEPVDGTYGQAVFTDFPMLSNGTTSRDGKLVRTTLTLREMTNPLTYFDGKMAGQTPTAVSPTITFAGFTNNAKVTTNVGYYLREEAEQLNISGYHVANEYELSAVYPGALMNFLGSNSTVPIYIKADKVLGGYREQLGHLNYYEDRRRLDFRNHLAAQIGSHSFEYANGTFIRGNSAESIDPAPYNPGDRTWSPVPYVFSSLRLLEDPNKKIVVYALLFDKVAQTGSTPYEFYTQIAVPQIPGLKRIRLLNSTARYAYRFSYYRDKVVIEACPVGADPNIQTAKDVRDRNVFATSTKVERREIVYVPRESGRKDGGFTYNRRQAGQVAKWPPAGSGRPTIWTHSIPEYPFLPLTFGFKTNYRDRAPYIAIDGQGDSFTPIGTRYNTAPEVVPPYSSPYRYPVLLFKNKD